MTAAAPPADEDVASLTSIRGVAAFWVVLLHFSAVMFGLLPEAGFLNPLLDAGVFAVPLFFILSGYVLGLRYLTKFRSPTPRSVLRFWWLRLGRVYPVHACTLLVSLAMVARHGWPTDEGHTPESFVANVFLTHAWSYDFRMTWNYPSWSISSEWFAYLLFPFAAALLARTGRRSAVVLVAVTCGLSAGAYAFEQHHAFKGLAFVVHTFVGGMGLAIVCPPGSWRRGGRLAEAGVLLAALLPAAVGPGPVQSALYLVLFFGLIGGLGAAGNAAGRVWRSHPLVFLGEISYSLYMTHVVTITLMTRFLPFDAVSASPAPARVAATLGSLAVVVGVSVGSYYVVERPLRNLSRRFGLASASTPPQSAPDRTLSTDRRVSPPSGAVKV